MISRNYEFNFSRDFARLIFAAALLILVIAGITSPKIFQQEYSGLFLVGVTLFYAYFTYEILRSTRMNRVLPHISIDYIVVSKIDSDALQDYIPYIDPTEKFIQVKKDLSLEGATSKDIIFVKLENVGDSVAIDVEFEIQYSKKNLGEEQAHQSKKISFRDLKRGQIAVGMLEVYDNPSTNDYFDIEKCLVKFNDVSRRYSKEGAMMHDFSKQVHHTRDDGVSIVFKDPTGA